MWHCCSHTCIICNYTCITWARALYKIRVSALYHEVNIQLQDIIKELNLNNPNSCEMLIRGGCIASPYLNWVICLSILPQRVYTNTNIWHCSRELWHINVTLSNNPIQNAVTDEQKVFLCYDISNDFVHQFNDNPWQKCTIDDQFSSNV